MKHVTVADKSLLSGDEAVELLIEYATLLARESTADSVDLSAIGPDGADVTVTFLLNSGVSIVAETTASNTPEPDNAKVEQYLHDRIAHLRGLGEPSPEDIAGAAIWNSDDWTSPDEDPSGS